MTGSSCIKSLFLWPWYHSGIHHGAPERYVIEEVQTIEMLQVYKPRYNIFTILKLTFTNLPFTASMREFVNLKNKYANHFKFNCMDKFLLCDHQTILHLEHILSQIFHILNFVGLFINQGPLYPLFLFSRWAVLLHRVICLLRCTSFFFVQNEGHGK